MEVRNRKTTTIKSYAFGPLSLTSIRSDEYTTLI